MYPGIIADFWLSSDFLWVVYMVSIVFLWQSRGKVRSYEVERERVLGV